MPRFLQLTWWGGTGKYDTIYFKGGETKAPGHKRDLTQCFGKSSCETSIGTRRQAPQGQSRAVATPWSTRYIQDMILFCHLPRGWCLHTARMLASEYKRSPGASRSRDCAQPKGCDPLTPAHLRPLVGSPCSLSRRCCVRKGNQSILSTSGWEPTRHLTSCMTSFNFSMR